LETAAEVEIEEKPQERKRQRKAAAHLEPAAASSGNTALPAVPAAEKRKIAKKRAAAALPKKMMLFDLDILEMVRRGENASWRLLALTGVDSSQFSQRAGYLCAKGLLCRDASNPEIFRLGLKGYDELAKKKLKEEKKAAKAQAAKKEGGGPQGTEIEKIEQEKKEEDARTPGDIYPQEVGLPEIAATPAAPQKNIPVPAAQMQAASQRTQAQNGEIDLFDLLKRGSPRPGDPVLSTAKNVFVERQQQKAAQQAKRIPFEQQVAQLGGKDAVKRMIEETTQSGMCELCRAPFKLSANSSENNPKYGYCFCGAAYHKDCFESIAGADGGSCVRCGKKLRIQMDRASEEAVKAVKKMFD